MSVPCIRSIIVLELAFISFNGYAQSCSSGQLYSNDAYLYGRFEVGMQSIGISGVVSSFFLYNKDLDCNWPAENNEIDIEMTGNDMDLQFTTHYPGPWYVTKRYTPSFNPHAEIHDYAIEWEPGIVRWFVDGHHVYTQDHAAIDELIHPLRIFMNLWSVDNEAWAGPWDPSTMPVASHYEYVKCYAYTPGEGNYGTNDDFTFLWEDNFESFDQSLWTKDDFFTFSGNYCTFGAQAVTVDSSILTLHLDTVPDVEFVPVTFHVDVSQSSVQSGDVVYLNGEFNNWCGTCNPMEKNGDIWSLTLDLSTGKHEYIYTKNFWEENGGAPLQSSCDFYPCDEWLNYGLTIPLGSDPIELDTICWAECTSCIPLGVKELETSASSLLRVTDILGRKINPNAQGLQIWIYEDGSVRKIYRSSSDL